MLTFQDCIAFCDLTEDEVAAVAEHERIPLMVAAELGHYLVQGPRSVPMLKRIILDDIAEAKARGDTAHAFKLRLVLYHFVRSHPDTASAA